MIKTTNTNWASNKKTEQLSKQETTNKQLREEIESIVYPSGAKKCVHIFSITFTYYKI